MGGVTVGEVSMVAAEVEVEGEVGRRGSASSVERAAIGLAVSVCSLISPDPILKEVDSMSQRRLILIKFQALTRSRSRRINENPGCQSREGVKGEEGE